VCAKSGIWIVDVRRSSVEIAMERVWWSNTELVSILQNANSAMVL
jgi:hypothetical protein